MELWAVDVDAGVVDFDEKLAVSVDGAVDEFAEVAHVAVGDVASEIDLP